MFRLRAPLLVLSRNYTGQRLRRPRIVVQRPQPEDLQTRVFKAVTEPVLPPVVKTEADRYLEILERRLNSEENRYEAFRISETLKMLDRSEKEIVVLVSSLWHKKRDRRECQALIKPLGYEVFEHDAEVARKAVQNTKYSPLGELFNWTTLCLVGAKEPSKVSDVLRVLRKYRFLVPICGIVENRILNRDDLIEYTELPAIGELHATTVGTLLGHLASSIDTLSTCQLQLVGLLNARQEQLAKGNKPAAAKAENAAPATS